jgi:hypothetical protein
MNNGHDSEHKHDWQPDLPSYDYETLYAILLGLVIDKKDVEIRRYCICGTYECAKISKWKSVPPVSIPFSVPDHNLVEIRDERKPYRDWFLKNARKNNLEL